MKTAIVFGANGYLGRHIAYHLKQENIQFIPTGNSIKSIDNYSNYKRVDVTKKEDLQQLDFNVDYVFAFAGLTGTKSSPEIIENFTKVNELGLANVISCCQGIDNLRIVFPSTRLVYKGIENIPLKEDAKKESKTIYAKNKLRCEELLTNSSIKHTIFRICVPYGNIFDNNYSYGTIGFFIGKASQLEDITIYGDGSLKRTFTHVKDIAQSIIQALEHATTINEVYNIGSDDALSLLEVANLVAQKYGVNVAFIEWPKEALKIESGDTIFNDEKLINDTNYKYQYQLKKWILELE